MSASNEIGPNDVALRARDALIAVDVQNDFLPGGALAVPHGDEVVATLNAYIRAFTMRKLPVIATRDWHPADHCSFRTRGGTWPPHCVAGTPGAELAAGLDLPDTAIVVDKAQLRERDAYSGFDGTALAERLRALAVERIFVGGLATDYCVMHTVLDALREGFATVLLEDAIRAVDVTPGDGARAVDRMRDAGAVVAKRERVLE